MNAKRWGYVKISREAARMTGERAGTDAHVAACVIIAGLIVGADARAVAKRLGCELKDIRQFAAGLRSNGIWRGKKTDSEAVEDGVAFNMSVACALGLVRRTRIAAAAAVEGT